MTRSSPIVFPLVLVGFALALALALLLGYRGALRVLGVSVLRGTIHKSLPDMIAESRRIHRRWPRALETVATELRDPFRERMAEAQCLGIGYDAPFSVELTDDVCLQREECTFLREEP